MIDWVECEDSEHLKAEGKKGQYWIEELAWTYVRLVTSDSAGINEKKLGAFNSVEDAKHFVKVFDTQEEEE